MYAFLTYVPYSGYTYIHIDNDARVYLRTYTNICIYIYLTAMGDDITIDVIYSEQDDNYK